MNSTVNKAARKLASLYREIVEWRSEHFRDESYDKGDSVSKQPYVRLSAALGPVPIELNSAGRPAGRPAGRSVGMMYASVYASSAQEAEGGWQDFDNFESYVHVWVAPPGEKPPPKFELIADLKHIEAKWTYYNRYVYNNPDPPVSGKRKREDKVDIIAAYDKVSFNNEQTPATGQNKFMVIVGARGRGGQTVYPNGRRGWSSERPKSSLCIDVLWYAVAEYNKKPVKNRYHEHLLRRRSYTRAHATAFLADRVRKLQSSPQSYSISESLQEIDNWAAVHPHLRGIARSARRNPFNTNTKTKTKTNCVAGGNKLFTRQPTKREVGHMVSHWTTEAYGNLQAARRTGSVPINQNVPNVYNKESTKAVYKLNMALALHMKKYALRAPQMPPKVRNVVTGSATPVLYRGLRLTPGQLVNLGRSGLQELGYTAFSRNPTTSFRFALKEVEGTIGVLLRLSTTDVQRGTPWIWYTSATESIGKVPANAGAPGKPGKYYMTPYHYLPVGLRVPGDNKPLTKHPRGVHASFVQGSWEEEYEVLMPPGTLLALPRFIAHPTLNRIIGNRYARNSKNRVRVQADSHGIRIIDIKFMPDQAAKTLWKPAGRNCKGQATGRSGQLEIVGRLPNRVPNTNR